VRVRLAKDSSYPADLRYLYDQPSEQFPCQQHHPSFPAGCSPAATAVKCTVAAGHGQTEEYRRQRSRRRQQVVSWFPPVATHMGGRLNACPPFFRGTQIIFGAGPQPAQNRGPMRFAARNAARRSSCSSAGPWVEARRRRRGRGGRRIRCRRQRCGPYREWCHGSR